ncbi:MAG: protein kinase [Phycisphaerae bacterium]|jgi:tetratricopeptide (TPR) repeat protein/tRNA A-37 threonylcarbamoyl transferase component Bud32
MPDYADSNMGNEPPRRADQPDDECKPDAGREKGDIPSADAMPTQTLHDGRGVLDPHVPLQIGQYRIRRVIASGGMGTVYEAAQERPRRVVAVKVMKHGVTSRSALRRFEFESQLLAQLRHPGVAQVFEAGTQEVDGGVVPYFAMEFIPEAKSITAYAEDVQLGVRERIELFRQVCDAVEHGHRHGIIHRDLKPGNILVDASGQTKVIDFGIARSTDSDIAITTMQTDVGQLMGTLQYMSPEQCEADPSKIDGRSDVYALGVMLYQLLCGQLPYSLYGVPVYEAARTIREEPPTRLSTVSRLLRGEIETIVSKALEKDRERRYPSAKALSDDLERYLQGEPIIARKPTVTYRVGKFLKKRKAVVAGAFVLVMALSVAGFFGIQARRAAALAAMQAAQRLFSEARLEAHRDPAKAVEKCDEALELFPDYFEAMIERVVLLRRVNRSVEARSAAEEIVERYPDQAGPAHLILGQLLRDRDPPAAALHLREGARLLPDDQYYKAIALEKSESSRAIELLTQVIDSDVLNFNALWARAWRYLEVGDFEAMLADAERLTDRWPETAIYWNVKGLALSRLGRYEEALKAYTAALRRRPGDALMLLNRADTYRALMLAYEGPALQRAASGAIADCTEAIEKEPDLARAYALRADCRLLMGDYAAAWADCQRAVKLDPDGSFGLRAMGHLLIQQGRYEEALDALERGMANGSQRVQDFHDRARARRIAGQYRLAMKDHNDAVEMRVNTHFVIASRAVTRRMMGDADGAVADLEQAIALNPSLWGVQGNLMIWDIHALDQSSGGVDAAETALSEAVLAAGLEKEESPTSVMVTDMCAGRRTADEVMAQATHDVERCIFAYFAGVKCAVDGNRADARTWFMRSRNIPAYGEFFIDLADWQLARLKPD